MGVTANPSVFTATRAPNEEWLAGAIPEEVLEPELAIVDPHMHLWEHKTGYTYFVKEFAHDVAACGHKIESTVFVECHAMHRPDGPEHLKSVGETEFAVGMAAMAASGKYTTCRAAAAIVGSVDLAQGEQTREALLAHVEAGNGRFRGVRQRGKWDPDPVVRGPVSAPHAGVYLDEELGRGVDLLTSMGLVFEASVFHHQIPDVAALARAHPDASIVLVHTGSPVGHSSYLGRDAEVHATWLAGMKELAQCPNVSMKLGGLLMCLGNFDFTTAPTPPTSEQVAKLWQPYIEPCLELFGAERCMVSSNYPVEKAGLPYGTIWNAFKRMAARCSSHEKHQLFSGTAKRIYQMD